MSGLTWFPFYVKAWIGDTRELSHGARAIYIDILCAMYARGTPLPADEKGLARITGCATVRSLRPLLAELIRAGKLHVEDGFLVNDRTMEELAKSDALRERCRRGGKARSARVQGEFELNTSRTQPVSEGQIEENQSLDLNQPQPQPQSQKEEKEEKEAYRFVGKVIRLTESDFVTWQRRYHAVADLEAELGGLDDWWNHMHPPDDAKRAKWFFPISNALAKKHQKLMAEIRGIHSRPDDVAAEVDRFYRDVGVVT